MAQAYDFALEKMGMDFASYTIWNDYILFLKGVDAVGSYAENQKISAIRKIYHRGVKIPMLNVEILWYDNEFIFIQSTVIYSFFWKYRRTESSEVWKLNIFWRYLTMKITARKFESIKWTGLLKP